MSAHCVAMPMPLNKLILDNFTEDMAVFYTLYIPPHVFSKIQQTPKLLAQLPDEEPLNTKASHTQK